VFNPNEWKQRGDEIVAGDVVIAEGVDEANGRLIVAAPQMYALLRDIADDENCSHGHDALALVAAADGTGPAILLPVSSDVICAAPDDEDEF
jgi:hypothetical protein